MAKEARVIQLQKDLIKLGYLNTLRAVNWMIEVMNANNGYKRHDGRHYYYHLVDGCQDLINHGIRDEDTLTAYVLHDAEEDILEVTNELIAEKFNREVAFIVKGVTKIDDVDYKDSLELQAYLDDILLYVKRCLVKTADRKHNFSTLHDSSPKHEMRQAIETEKFFLPFLKEARKRYPEHSAYFHSAKTSIVPILNRIKKAHAEETRLKNKIVELESKLEQEKKRNKALEKKIRSVKA